MTAVAKRLGTASAPRAIDYMHFIAEIRREILSPAAVRSPCAARRKRGIAGEKQCYRRSQAKRKTIIAGERKYKFFIGTQLAILASILSVESK